MICSIGPSLCIAQEGRHSSVDRIVTIGARIDADRVRWRHVHSVDRQHLATGSNAMAPRRFTPTSRQVGGRSRWSDRCAVLSCARKWEQVRCHSIPLHRVHVSGWFIQV